MWPIFVVQFSSSICNIDIAEFRTLDSLIYSVYLLAKTPGAQIGHRGCFSAPGAAEFWYTWIGGLALWISVWAY
jgi:hypothetical protein